MKIYISEQATESEAQATESEAQDSIEVVLTETPAGIRIEHKSTGAVFEFDNALPEFRPDILNLIIDQENKIARNWFSEVSNNRDGLVSQRTRNMCFDLNARYVASIAVLADGSFSVYSNHRVKVVASVEPVVVGYKKSTDVFLEHEPSLVKFIQHGRAKQRALARINQSDSTAALELQVDMLTRVVRSLVEAAPSLKPAWWDAYIAGVQAQESTAVFQNESAVVASIVEEKERVRQIQAQYFAELAEIYGAV